MNQSFESCSDVRAALPLWVGGDLEANENLAVQRHLDRCDGCLGAAELADQSRRALVLRLESEVQPTPDLWAGISAQLETGRELIPVEPAAPVLAGPGSWLRRAGLGVASAAAALLVTFSVADRLLPERASAPTPAMEGVGAVAGEPSMPGESLPVVAPLAVGSAAAVDPSWNRRLRPMGPGSTELWRNAETVSLENLRLLRDEVRYGQDSEMRLTGDR